MITHTPAEPLRPFFARAVASAKAKVAGNDRWLAAIGRAEETFADLQALTFLETGELLVPGRQPGVVYAATPTTCQCKAATYGQPCRHRALARLIEIALGLQAQSQRAAPAVAAAANGKTAAEEIAELFE